jgi:Arylsulfotransferase (ASST)
VAALGLKTIVVTGSVTGPHAGRMRRYASAPGESFLMSEPFQAGETVTVQVGLPVAGSPSGTYAFTVAQQVHVSEPAATPRQRVTVPGVQHFLSNPGLDPPTVKVERGKPVGEGDLLLTPKGWVGNPGPMILSPTGTLIWFDPLSREAFDLNVQRYHSRKVLTWWQGTATASGGGGEDVIEDSSYRQVAVVTGGNGFRPDLHEFQLTSQGSAWVTSHQTINWNATSAGGPVDGIVSDGIVQEIDVSTGLVMYEWHSLDHVSVGLSTRSAVGSATTVDDYFHVNSIQVLRGGDLLVSARNTSAVYEIDPSAEGAIVWELGGEQSSFVMGPDTTFWFQHDARELSPGVISLFDDEAAPAHATRSRALELRLNLVTHTATVQKVIEPPGKLLATALGSVQTIRSGDAVVSWGTTGTFTESNASGGLVFEASLPPGDNTYRTYLASWAGNPAEPPSLEVSSAGGKVTGAVSWNGATAVAKWRILAGSSPTTLEPTSTIANTTFEETFTLPAADAYVEAQALSTSGTVLRSSRIAHP